MAKVTKYPIKSFNPVICKACGCEYEFEVGDNLKRIFLGLDQTPESIFKYEKNAFILDCPICCMPNRIEKK